MIKSPERQYNAYRILKVLSNQDYLAVDYTHLYFILSPINSRYHAIPRNSFKKHQTNIHQQNCKILKPKECIQIDYILYYVFPVGKNQVICANSVDLVKFNNTSHLFHFFAGAVREILRLLLIKDSKEVRKCIDIKNAIIIKGQLYLLDLNRGKIYPRSLQKSQKLGMNRERDDSFRKILQNQFRIIKYFGLLIWQIVYKSDFYAKNSRVDQVDEKKNVKKLLTDMINKTITYQYLQIKISQEEQKQNYCKQRKHKKPRLLIKRQNIVRYNTSTSRNSEKRIQFKQISIQSFKPTLNSPCFSRKKRMVTQIQTGSQVVQAFPSRFFNFKVKKTNRFSPSYSVQYNTNPSRYEDTKINDKLLRQGQLAKIKFNKFVQSKFELKEQNQEINQTLRTKLINKMERFKTEYKNYSSVRSYEPTSYSQNRLAPQQIQEQPVSKKLQFEQLHKKAQIEQIEINQIQKQSLQDLSCVKVEQQKKDGKPSKKLMDNFQFQEEKIMPQQNDQPLDPLKQQIIKDSYNIQFEVIHLQKKPQQLANNQSIKQNQQQTQVLVKRINQNANSKTISNQQYLQNKNKQKDSNNSMQKKKLKNEAIQRYPPNDEIETIKLEKTVSQDKKQKIITKLKQPLKNQKKKASAPKIIVEQLVTEYESLISVLGHICLKVMQNKNELNNVIEWQKPLYFVYERYLYERQRMEQALLLGVKQITRKNRLLSDEDWDQWLHTQSKKKLLQKVQFQNKQIRQNFNRLTNKTLKTCNFSRKIDYYVRNRQKFITSSAVKARQVLSKITISFIVKTFDKITESLPKNKQATKLIFDLVYAALIICQLDNVTDNSQWVSLSNYQKYSINLQKLNPIVDLIYQLYYDQQTFNEID